MKEQIEYLEEKIDAIYEQMASLAEAHQEYVCGCIDEEEHEYICAEHDHLEQELEDAYAELENLKEFTEA